MYVVCVLFTLFFIFICGFCKRCEYPTFDDADRIALAENALAQLTPDTLRDILQKLIDDEAAAAAAARLELQELEAKEDANNKADLARKRKAKNRAKGKKVQIAQFH